MISVVFRVDASSVIGTGHLFRCKYIASQLLNRGISVLFVCRQHQNIDIESLLYPFEFRILPRLAKYNYSLTMAEYQESYASFLAR